MASVRAAQDGLVEEEEEIDLETFLAGLKAKYMLESINGDEGGAGPQPQESGPQQVASPAMDSILAGGVLSTEPGEAQAGVGQVAPPGSAPADTSTWQTPQSLLSSPEVAPAPGAPSPQEPVSGSSPTSVAAAAAAVVAASPPPATASAQPAAASPAGQLDQLESPQSEAWLATREEPDGIGEDADYKQLLQLEALEEQLARQSRLLDMEQSEAVLYADGLGTGNLTAQSSLPNLASTSSAPSDTPCSSLADGASVPSFCAGAAGEGCHPGWAAHQTWAALSTQLVQLGFPPICSDGSQPDSAAVFVAINSMLNECRRCSKHSQQMGEAAQQAARREDLLLKRFEAAVRAKDVEVQKWKRLALQSQRGLRDTQQLERQSQAAAHRAAAACKQLEQELSRLQHELRAKDLESDRLQQRLGAALDKENRRAAADKKAYEALKRAFVASKGATTPKAGAAFVANAAREMRPVDIVRVYEQERAELQEEVAIMRAEHRVLIGQLERARAAMQHGHAVGGALIHQQQSIDEEEQARAMARQSAAAVEQTARLEEEVLQLQQELASRPTPEQYASLQRQVDIMDRHIAKLAAEKAANAKANSATPKPKLRQLSTREAILRGKNLARLGLYAAEEFPKPVLLEIVQDACILLECSDPLKLGDAIKPIQETAGLVPRLQKFVDSVCWTVFQKGLAHVPAQWRQDSPTDIPAILGSWITELGELMEMRGVVRGLLRALASRAGLKPNQQPPTVREIVPLVGQLVDFERAALHSREVISAAEAVLASQPGLLVNRIVSHFLELFGCKLEGALPCMNKLYLSHSEAQGFLRSLRVALGLEAGASLEACTNRIQQLLDHKQELLGASLPNPQWHVPAGGSAAGGAGGAAQEELRAGVVIIERPTRGELQRGAEVAVDRMAARRNFPKVEIFVPAPRLPLAEQAPNQAGQ